LGGNPEVDVPYQYISVFCYDDAHVKDLHDSYKSGIMFSSDMKEELIKVIVPFIEEHKKARAAITDELVSEFMRVRPLIFTNKI